MDAVGDALKLDVRRFPFTVGHGGATLSERVALVESVHRDLSARDLVRGSEFAPDLVEGLRLFAEAPLGIALVGTVRDAPLVARAASDGRDGVLAVQQGDVVAFHRHSADTVVRALVGLLPELRPGPGSSVVVTASPRRTPDEDFSQFRFTSGVRPAAGGSAAVEMMRWPRIGAGHFSATTRKDHREVELGAFSYLDTEAGRYAILPGADSNGRPNATCTPADRRYLTVLLRRFIGSTE
ncbi:ESX secretion-associated protein EspG [Actinosynnema sp. CA-299493]